MASSMQAIRFHTYGDPGVLVKDEVPRPEPAPGEVLVEVHAAGVNPLDWKVRAGHVKEWLQHRLPLIPGWDVSGVIAAVGPEVASFQEGDQVFGMLDFKRDGAYAEFVTTQTLHLVPKPASLDHVQAAAVPLASLTAWQALFEIADLRSGQTVLIHAAAGGVGHFAVQLAKWQGARVIGTASAGNADFLRELGADEVIDYRSTPFFEKVHDVDVVLDPIGGDTQKQSWQVLKKGGILVATLGITSPEIARQYGGRGQGVAVHPDSNQLGRIVTLIDIDHFKPVVTTVLPLDQAAKAHVLSQTGHTRGKIVLQVRP
jgi:NADPH:quinone reductase-like Zn-dependent oxidoreductase